MTAKEARQEQWNKLKDQPLSAKLKYIFTYYWGAIALSVFALIFATSWIVGALTQKEVVLSGSIINSIALDSYQDNIAEEFLADQQLDSEEYTFDLLDDVLFNATDISAVEHIATRIYTGDLDFIVADLEAYTLLSAYFADLETVLTKEQLEKYRPYFVYVERDALETLEQGDQGSGLVFPKYYLDDAELEDPIALGIRIPKTSCLFEAYAFPDEEIILGFTETNRHVPVTIAFLEFLFREQ